MGIQQFDLHDNKRNGECLDFTGFISDMAQFKKDFKAQKADLDNLVKLAKQAAGDTPKPKARGGKKR